MKSKNVITKRVSNNKTPDIIRDNIAVDIGVNGLTVAQCSEKYNIARQSINRWLRNDRDFSNIIFSKFTSTIRTTKISFNFFWSVF